MAPPAPAPPAPTPQQLEEAAWQKIKKWFDVDLCARLRPRWEARMAEFVAEPEEVRNELAKRFADNAEAELARTESELNSMQQRTATIVAAASLMFAVFFIKSDSGNGVLTVAGTILLGVALMATAIAFTFTVKAMAPPFRRAWREPYELREHWSLLVVTDFDRWAMACYLGNRRTPVIQKYKKAHALTVRLLVVAVALTVPALGLVIFG